MESNFIHIGVYGQPHSNMHNDTDPKDRKRKKRRTEDTRYQKDNPCQTICKKILGIRVNEAINGKY